MLQWRQSALWSDASMQDVQSSDLCWKLNSVLSCRWAPALPSSGNFLYVLPTHFQALKSWFSRKPWPDRGCWLWKHCTACTSTCLIPHACGRWTNTRCLRQKTKKKSPSSFSNLILQLKLHPPAECNYSYIILMHNSAGFLSSLLI